MLLAKQIKAIFFDLDGTLRYSDPPGYQVFAAEATRLGLKISSEDMLRAARWEHYYFAGSDDIHADDASYPNQNAFWLNYTRRFLILLGAPPELAKEMAEPLYWYMGERYHPRDELMPGIKDALETFKKADVVLAVVSNREKSYGKYLKEIGLADYFKFSVAAGEVQSWKPDKKIFEHALHLAGVQAAEAIYIGDNYFADVVGARKAGLKPVLLDVEGIFGEPDCPVVSSHQQFLDLLEQGDIWKDQESETHPG